ncbi:DUF3604 domain-containing protein [Pelagibius sp. Alg239-R121]|uniref:DUF3604 domain-containing protein n=1 Tax=Pelagibius sp. Alg239-R121 TaxID=2993448 RepID=UPI0024A79809|nr:DUF3604 domain-containing protein [Pelagibius sp. Alg239-R121]
MASNLDGPVSETVMGEVWPAAQPGEDPVLYGHARLEPNNPVEVRSLQTFRLTYQVGRYGLDDTGAIRIVFRALGDWGRMQTTDPQADNYVTATTSNGVPLNVEYSRYGISPRPRWKTLTVRVMGGFLREGDRITVVFGDTSGGSRGMVMQTFVEAGFEFKVLADVCAVGHFVPIPETLAIAVIPSKAAVWRAVLPSLRRPGESFRFGLKAEDIWGNPTDKASGRFTFKSTLPVSGLPSEYVYEKGKKSVSFENLSVSQEGILRITVLDQDAATVAESHPLIVRKGEVSGYWGDLHGQSGESIGVTTSRQYFDFARNKAFLDVTGHQANDFQVNNAFWKYLNELTAEYNEEGTFVTFPGYEWSGNTAVGGDRNVFFRDEGRQIRRSSHALLTDRSDLDTDAPDAAKLFQSLEGENAVVYAHVGGRYADIGFAHDPKFETAMEIHSAWGTFEWLLTDGFPLGHRSGVVCNSDGHKGRPGASYPGASTFGAYGGLTCFLTQELSRDAIFDCLRRRHHYGTTGTRLHMDVRVSLPGGGVLFDQDPKVFNDTPSKPVNHVMMGDIVQTDDEAVTLSLEVIAQAPIERIEIRNGTEVLQTLRPYDEADLGDRIRVLWSGAEYRGRGRDSLWEGHASFQGATIGRMEKINAWNHERLLEISAKDTVTFEAVTTGNYGGFDVWLDKAGEGTAEIVTNHGTLALPYPEIGLEDHIMEAGGLERRIKLFRLPEMLETRQMTETVTIPLNPVGDNPLWISVYTEDGFQAWSSPVFAYRKDSEPV